MVGKPEEVTRFFLRLNQFREDFGERTPNQRSHWALKKRATPEAGTEYFSEPVVSVLVCSETQAVKLVLAKRAKR